MKNRVGAKPWTEAECTILREHRTASRDELCALLPGRTTDAIWKQRRRLGISMQPPDTYTPRQLARALGLPRATALEWVRSGTIPAVSVRGLHAPKFQRWYVPWDSLETFIMTHPFAVPAERIVDDRLRQLVVASGSGDWLTVREAAAVMGTTMLAVYAMIDAGTLGARRFRERYYLHRRDAESASQQRRVEDRRAHSDQCV